MEGPGRAAGQAEKVPPLHGRSKVLALMKIEQCRVQAASLPCQRTKDPLVALQEARLWLPPRPHSVLPAAMFCLQQSSRGSVRVEAVSTAKGTAPRVAIKPSLPFMSR